MTRLGQLQVEGLKRDGMTSVDDGGDDPGQGADDGPVARGQGAGRVLGQEVHGQRGPADDPEATEAVAGADEREAPTEGRRRRRR